MDRVCRIPEDAKAGGRRDGLFEQLQVLGAQLQTLVRPSRNVAPGTCQATHDSAPYWIGGKADDDWYRRGGLLAARAAGVLEVAMRSTFRRTSSAASAGRRSIFPSANRTSKTMFLPATQPRSRSPCWNASR